MSTPLWKPRVPELHCIEPVTQLARDHRRIFGLLRNGPVILAQHSKPAAVLVDVATWNEAVRRLAAYERLAIVERAAAAIRAGEFATLEEVDAGFKERGFSERSAPTGA